MFAYNNLVISVDTCSYRFSENVRQHVYNLQNIYLNVYIEYYIKIKL